MNRPFSALFALTMVAGCTAGPDYHVPEHAMINAPAAKAPFASSASPLLAQTDLPAQWWRLYDDPRLDGYVREALAANTDLRAADAHLRQASEIVREAEAGRQVQTSLNAATYGARVGGYTLTMPLSVPYSYVMSAQVSYPLDLAGGVRRGIEAARDSAEATQAARDQVRVTVAATVARNYAAICSANVTLAAQQHVLDLERKTLGSMQRLFKAGRGTTFDVIRAKAAAADSAASIPPILVRRQAALFELAALMGRAPADYPQDMASCAVAPKLTSPLPVGDGTMLLKRRPDVRASERQLAAATANIGVETAQLYPQVALSGSLGFANAISAFTSPDSFGGFAGPMVSWAFPNRKLLHARIAAAGDAAQAAEADFDGTVIEALRQTETALFAYVQEARRDAALEEATQAADKATVDADRLFRFGRSDVLSLLTSQERLAQAETKLATSRAELLDRQVNVFLALGGGWENVDAAAPGVGSAKQAVR